MFMAAESTNQHDVVRFLKLIRDRIVPEETETDAVTFVVLDNHVAHKTRLVRDYIAEDYRNTGHRFELEF